MLARSLGACYVQVLACAAVRFYAVQVDPHLRLLLVPSVAALVVVPGIRVNFENNAVYTRTI